MLRLLEIPSARAESSSYRVNLVLADFRARSASLVADSPQARDAARDAVFRLVALAEIFASELVLDITERQLPDAELIARIWDERSSRIVRDWGSRKSAWKDLFEVEWTFTRNNELQAFVTARNIIAHGIGRLTRTQLQRGKVRESVLKSLAHAQLRVDGDRLLLDVADVDRCGDCVQAFIAWLDEESKNSPLSIV